MADDELINIYKEAYDTEFEEQYKIAYTFYEEARDKSYALQLGFFAISLSNLFRGSSELEKSINDLYIHTYRLGGNVIDVIKTIPVLTQEYIEKKRNEKLSKSKVNIVWEKFAGIIPYKIKHIQIKKELQSFSHFENLTRLEDIAFELGKQRAIIDLQIQLKLKLSTYGFNFEEINNLNYFKELPIIYNLKTSLEVNDLDTFFKILQAVFGSLSYNIKFREAYFHVIFHSLLKVANLNVISELETNEGRIDAVTENENYVHIFEFKLNSCQLALNQIKDKKYYQSYLNSSKKLILVGVAFDKNKGNIKDWCYEKFN